MAELTVQQTNPADRLPTKEELNRTPNLTRLFLREALEAGGDRELIQDGRALAGLVGPQTDEQLLDAVEGLTGHRIPRVAVCTEHGHSSPAQTFCDLYFERIFNCLWIGNRGGGKTANSGELHGAKCRYKPEYTSAIAGAQEKQGYRAYAEFRAFLRQLGDEIVSTLMSKTVWRNGSETEVLGGTVKQLNGPHPHLAQMDEVELSSWEAFEEFLNMAQGDNRYQGQQLLTSTRKKAHGIVQSIVKECQEAIRHGDLPPWETRIFCVFETMAKVPECRSADPVEREAALKALGRDPTELCNCDKIKKGTMDDGGERTFEKVCGGRAFRADGFVQLRDVHKRFRQLSSHTWTAQQECLTPNIEGVVHKWLTERHSLVAWLPRPEFGPIYRGWDWGGNNPHAVVWCQLTSVPVAITNNGLPLIHDDDKADIVSVIPEGTFVQFDEIYKTSDELPNDGGFSDLAHVVAMRELEWRGYGYSMQIARDFCDPAGFIAKREVKKKYRELIDSGEYPDSGLQVPEFKSIPAPVMESVRLHISWGEAGRIRIVEQMCPHTSDEYDVYHWPDKQDGKNLKEEPVKDDDHAMDAKRYMIWNIEQTASRAPSGETPGAQLPTKPEEPRTLGPMGQQPVEPAESPVGAVGAVPSNRQKRMRETATPGVRQLAPGRRFR